MKKVILLLCMSLFLLVGSCKDDEESINSPIDLSIEDYNNIPVLVNTENSFTFTVSANNFNYSVEEILNFTGDSTVVTITLAQASSIESEVSIFNDDGNIIFDEDLNGSKVVVNDNIIFERPNKIKIDLINFSGKLTLVVASD